MEPIRLSTSVQYCAKVVQWNSANFVICSSDLSSSESSSENSIESSRPVKWYISFEQRTLFRWIFATKRKFATESVCSITRARNSLRTNNRLPRVIMFVYLSSQQHGIFLNVFPTFFSHYNKDTYYLRLNTADKRTKHQKAITSDSTNLPLILNSILTFYFACRRQCRRRCFFGGHRTCFSFLFFLLFPQLNFTFPLWTDQNITVWGHFRHYFQTHLSQGNKYYSIVWLCVPFRSLALNNWSGSIFVSGQPSSK